jgi:ADP-ribose pyrophosphatase YjhB (NUDIX family)
VKRNRLGIPVLEGQRNSVAVFIITPDGVPLVRDPKKPSPLWKAPGGRCVAGEGAAEAAVREVEEEVGISLSEKELTLVQQVPAATHILFLFTANRPDLAGIKIHGDEGEEVRVFHFGEVLFLADFLPSHAVFKQKLIEYLSKGTSGS